MKGTEPRPIVAYVIVLFLIFIIVTNRELLFFLPQTVQFVPPTVVGSFFMMGLINDCGHVDL